MSTPGESSGNPLPPLTATPPWIAPETSALRAALRSDRLPHALLIHAAAGTGGEWLARWAAALALCEKPEAAPCGACTACRRTTALQHPDLIWVSPADDSRQIRIEQVRELSAELALTSHAGGYKIGVITPADALNRFAANALLKTLEEPPARTLLVLVGAAPSLLPPTIVSRCQRLKVRTPTRAEAIAWLTALRGPAEWDAALETLGDAPLLAAGTEPAELGAIGTETHRTLEGLAGGREDPVAAAERWARGELGLRLRCFENWLTERIRQGSGAHLSAPDGSLNIRRLFGLLDEVRELRATLDVPLNRALALEGLFRRLSEGERAR